MSESENKSSQFGPLAWVAVIAFIGLLVWAIVIPNFVKVRSDGGRPCIEIMRELQSAKDQWALENGKTNGTVATENDIKPYIKLNAKGDIPSCPQGGIYTIGKVGENPTCSLGTTVTPAHVLP